MATPLDATTPPFAAAPTRRDVAVLTVAVLALHLPFLGQALIIDDGKFVEQALHILQDPWHPYSFWIGLAQPVHFYGYFANPPVQGYLLAGVIALFGLSDTLLHVACLPFAALAVFATWALGRTLTGRGLLPALLILATPAFLLSSHTLMADVPMTAFYVVALLAFVRGVDRAEPRSLLLAGVAAGVATLFKYSALSILPLMVLHLCVRRRFSRETLAPIAVTLLLFGAWCLASWSIYGEVHFLAAGSAESVPRPVQGRLLQLVAVLLGVGAATVFAPFLTHRAIAGGRAIHLWVGRSILFASVSAFLLALVAPVVPRIDYDLPNRILGGVFLAAGVATTIYIAARAADALRALRAGPDAARAHGRLEPAHALLLSVWFLGFLVMNAGLLFATPKYIVPALVPLAILLANPTGEATAATGRASTRYWAAALAATLAFGIALSVVSARQGDFHRTVVEEWVPEVAAGRTVWFTGHWTVRHYSERMGHRYLPARPLAVARGEAPALPRTGDIVFEVPDSVGHPVPRMYEGRLELVDRTRVESPLRLAIANRGLRAGYWAHLLGLMPVVLSSSPLSEALVYRVAAPPR